MHAIELRTKPNLYGNSRRIYIILAASGHIHRVVRSDDGLQFPVAGIATAQDCFVTVHISVTPADFKQWDEFAKVQAERDAVHRRQAARNSVINDPENDDETRAHLFDLLEASQ